ncbi:hypothetical protein ACPCDX_15310 [Streptomyces koyangensis]|uniref:hypothetical protein n=1 Tax=Streptomyces koyangensis TaxID=188770 RepID=UPI003C30CB7F
MVSEFGGRFLDVLLAVFHDLAQIRAPVVEFTGARRDLAQPRRGGPGEADGLAGLAVAEEFLDLVGEPGQGPGPVSGTTWSWSPGGTGVFARLSRSASITARSSLYRSRRPMRT